ncbi:hypothetical protein HZS_4974 [Henneguya salminicola]|nr:hypothetical protein HZS_4974 [Henneguya salminicola]
MEINNLIMFGIICNPPIKKLQLIVEPYLAYSLGTHIMEEFACFIYTFIAKFILNKGIEVLFQISFFLFMNYLDENISIFCALI